MRRFQKTISFLLAFILSASVYSLLAQDNSTCNNAISIEDASDFCSELGGFDNLNASTTVDGFTLGIPGCWSGNDADANDVWFKFTAMARAVNVVISGTNNGGSLSEPQVALYVDDGCRGTVGSIECASDNSSQGVVNLSQLGLIIGQNYLIRVDGSNGGVGSFQLCINNFNPPKEPGQDCSSSSVLCDKSSFIVQNVSGAGDDPDEAAGTCLAEGGGLFINSEQRSTWFKWTAVNNGSLTFVITPLSLIDDLDWVLFELPNGLDDCDSKIDLRCNATFGGDNASCGPLTGMNDTSTEIVEDFNCDAGEDGFVRAINMVDGVSYALLVNNFSTSNLGFKIDFGGTGEFLGPEPAFVPNVNLDILECDRDVIFTDQSAFTIGTIVNWEWDFGIGASPQFASGNDPKTVVYESVGDKIAALTVESDKGCLVTYILEFTIQSCCDDFSDLSVSLTEENLVCANVPTGSILAEGVGGNPTYEYSFDNVDYGLNPNFLDLPADTYTIWVRDTKGCERSNDVIISQPAELTVDAGPDMETELGVPVEINASYSPPEYMVMLDWSPPEGVTCLDPDCFDISVVAPGTTTYTLTATNEVGCIAMDQVTINTLANYNVYPPNVIDLDPDQQGTVNNYFRLFAGPSAATIEELLVFDRWGNRMYRGTDLPLTDGIPDLKKGWDGKFRGKLVDSGIYSWVARVRFVDNLKETFKGDITVVR